jgi:purine-nucleoside phosphorylase
MSKALEDIKKAVDYIQSQSNITPEVGIVLGSGLGVYADQIENKTTIPYESIPGFYKTTVAGHKGQLILGEVKGVKVAAMQGRYHTYEGHELSDVVLPTRVLKFLGCHTLILTNAAGGINSNFKPGDLVYIKDHINMTGRNPLIGENIDELGPRFPDMTHTYDTYLHEMIEVASKEVGITPKGGIYCGLLGPTYETPAEIKMLRTLGGDMVGMSTVPEAIAANHMGMNIAGISCITNMAAGMGDEELKHDDVKEVARIAMNKFSELVTALVNQISKSGKKA